MGRLDMVTVPAWAPFACHACAAAGAKTYDLWPNSLRVFAQAQLEGMKAERNTLDASRKAEAAEARKALAEIDYLQVRSLDYGVHNATLCAPVWTWYCG
jgi:hypothetical protein